MIERNIDYIGYDIAGYHKDKPAACFCLTKCKKRDDGTRVGSYDCREFCLQFIRDVEGMQTVVCRKKK